MMMIANPFLGLPQGSLLSEYRQKARNADAPKIDNENN